jgi:hypothetical protein
VRNRKRNSEEREQASIKGTQEPLASKGISIEASNMNNVSLIMDRKIYHVDHHQTRSQGSDLAFQDTESQG